MEKFVFLRLTHILRERELLRDRRWVTIEEQLAIFLLTIGHNEDNRILQERFQHSGETISRYFNEVLRAIMELSNELIKPPSFSEAPAEILNNSKYFPWFKDCIGAIDGTHIKVIVPLSQQTPYFNRNGNILQNVMAVCSFDLKFTYIYAGWEGSANDSRILWETLSNRSMMFPHAPEVCASICFEFTLSMVANIYYYVVDAGYPNMPGFLAPYRGVRYHLHDCRRGSNGRFTAKELFNFGHSSLRNAFERSFRVLKSRFPTFRDPSSFPYNTQVQILIATCAIHNFIRTESKSDELFAYYANEENVIDVDTSPPDEPTFSGMYAHQQRRSEMNHVRDEIADAMYRFRYRN
ncbi:protein ALP1-like [Papaver somniferum]|uniref:protein ALP1-like n=1 Tax=Papaver somniferum TaxID=3469 RepID=UPI000E6FF884|nr:protein ALP1-like [Papaver somniferum]